MPLRKLPAHLPPALILLAVAVATRAIALGNPILHVDEQFYLAVAHGWARGAIPYVDIWDRKPVGLFLLYLPAGMLPLRLGVWAYQLMALASAWATALLIARAASDWRRPREGPDRGPLLAGVTYLVWIILAEGQGGQTPVFYNLLTASAALLVLRTADHPPRLRDQAAAMLLIGAAIQINPIIAFEGCWLGLWALRRQWRAGRGPVAVGAIATLLVAVALLPTLAAIGHVGDWWFANAQSIFGRHADPLAERLGNLAGVVAILSPLVAMAIIGLRIPGVWRGDARAFVAGWLAVSLGSLLLFGGWFDHYALRSMLPAAIAASAAMAAHRDVRRWAPWLLIVVAVGGQLLLVRKLEGRGTPAQFDRLVAAIGTGPGCLFVYASDPMIYPATGRCTVTRYQFPSHLARTREAGAIGVDQAGELRRIVAQRLAVIVVGPRFRGEDQALRALLLRAMAGRYGVKTRLPIGHARVAVYAVSYRPAAGQSR